MRPLVVLACVAAGCVPAARSTDDGTCAPPRASPGESRVRRLACNDDRVPGGEGRIGDWILENARARFVVRSHPGSLYRLEGPDAARPGWTLVDAVGLVDDPDGHAIADGSDLLAELVPDGAQVELFPHEGASGAGMLDATGTRGWFLPPDTDRLSVLGTPDATWIPRPGVVRLGAVAIADHAVMLLDAQATPTTGSHVAVHDLRAIALSATGRWPDAVPYAGTADADAVELRIDGTPVLRTPVVDGAWSTEGPPGAVARGWRPGCTYDDAAPATTPVACVTRAVRARDADGRDVAFRLIAPDGDWTLPAGGGTVPYEGEGWLWAGPAWDAWPVEAGVAPVEAHLHAALTMDGWMLADLAAEVAPDADSAVTPGALRDARASEGVDAVVFLADDDVPTAPGNGGRTPRGEVIAVTASRTAGWLWSWPWSPSTRRAGHGAIPWRAADGTPRSALDQLAAARGLPGQPRRTVVTAAWVDAAVDEAPPRAWNPRPDAVWLAGPEDLPALVGLLQAWIPVAPVGPRTWLPVDAARDRVALDRALVEATTSTGSGPRLRWLRPRCAPGEALRRGAGPPPPQDEDSHWVIRAEAPTWAGLGRIEVLTGDPARGVARRRIAFTPGEDVIVEVSDPCAATADGPAWMVAVATGRRARPWSPDDGSAWAVSDVAWLRGPVDADGD